MSADRIQYGLIANEARGESPCMENGLLKFC